MTVSLVLLLVLAIMSVVAFVVYREDWQRACVNRLHNRIPEWVLFLLAFLFGAPGALIPMLSYGHKMRHKCFRIGIPALALLQLTLFFLCVLAGA